MKKIWIFVVCFLFLVKYQPPVLAATTVLNYTDGTFIYDIIDGIATIKDYTDNYYASTYSGHHLEIPEKADNKYPVKYIGDGAFRERTKIYSLSLPEGVIGIGMSAFERCSMLKVVTLCDSLEYIYPDAFNYCNIKNVEIPRNVNFLHGRSFRKCPSVNISVDEKNNFYTSVEGTVYDKEMTTLVLCPNAKGTYEIPQNVQFIGEYAFYYCDELEEVILSANVKKIGTGAFLLCESLYSVEIGGAIESIGAHAFQYCDNLKNVYIPDLVSWFNIQFDGLESNPAANCENLYVNGVSVSDMVVPDGVTEIDLYVFGKAGYLKSIVIPASVSNIGSNAFSDCLNLEKIKVEDSNLFYSSENGVLFDKSKTTIYKYPPCKLEAFYEIPVSVVTISKNAFKNSEIQKIIMPKSVKKIEQAAFYECQSLNDVYYAGNEQDFIAIEIDMDNDALQETIKFEYNGMEVHIKSVFCWCDNSTVTAEVALNYAMSDSRVLMAIYDGEMLVALKSEYIKEGDIEKIVECNTDLKCEGLKAKIFLWENNCSIKPVALFFEKEIVGYTVIRDVLQSSHPYKNDFNEVREYIYNGECSSIDLTFSEETFVETGYDFIYIYDGDYNEIGVYTGNELAGQTINVKGNAFKICLKSDIAVAKYGYKVESITVNFFD